jgi:hypothetical protein
MIRLKRHTVNVVEHDPEWATLAADACQAVRNACGELLVDGKWCTFVEGDATSHLSML